MTSLPVKGIGSVMAGNASTGTKTAVQSTQSVSFESVWNNQTEKQSQTDNGSDEYRAIGKGTNTLAKDSLKSKDTRKNVSEQTGQTEKSGVDELRDMDPEEWERAMEVLGTAAVEICNQLADAFDMTGEEIQELMTELGLEQLDMLQPDGLNQMILAAGGAENATELLTNEELYRKFQELMGQLNGVLEECSDSLQADVNALVEMAVAETDESDELSISVEVVQGDVTAENVAEDDFDDAHVEISPAEARQNRTEQTDSAETGNSGQNLLQQNLQTENLETQLQQLSEATSSWDADTQDIMKQIMDYMKIQVEPDMSNLEMQLHPESLGTLQIHVASKGGNITAQFVTQNEAVKAALESQMIQLKESFAEQGVKVDAIEVTVQTHQFEQNLEQGRGRQQEENGRRTRTRRIQLDDTISMDDLVSMEGEEQLAVEMMAANGNTVDYTA